MNKIIKKIYIITSDDKRYNNLVNIIKKNGIKSDIIKCKAVDPNKLTEKQMRANSSDFCNNFCSPDMIAKWLSHYNLWKSIVKRKESNVLILEDTAIPIKNFSDMFYEYWKEIPQKWDMIYFGCSGSCDSSLVKNTIYRLINNKINNDVYKDNKKMIFVIEPGFPLGLYGYMLSYEGAKKLIKRTELKKVRYHMDYYLANKIYNDNNFHVYAFNPVLIKNKIPNPKIENHEILEPLTNEINITKNQNVTDLWRSNLLYIRSLDIGITYMTLLLSILAILIGFKFKNQYNGKIFITVITFLQLFEIAYGKTDIKKIKTLFFEIFILYAFYYFGIIIGRNYEK